MNPLELAISITERMLRNPGQPDYMPRPEEIQKAAERVAQMLNQHQPDEPVDVERLVRELESRFSVWVGSATVLEDLHDHVDWLPASRNRIQWRFYTRYEDFLEDRKRWPPAMIHRLDETTDDVLSRLEDPGRNGKWDRRGLIVGQVQSGKTSHYTGLICKAADAGYRVVIVLAGMTNSLRSQTQLRLDEGFLGFDSRNSWRFKSSSPRVGVGFILPREGIPPIAHTGTNSQEDGDFSTRVALNFGIQPGGAEPVLLVVKKNKTVLENVRDWSRSFQSVPDSDRGHNVQKGVPLLLIDDEADYASINTRPLTDPTNSDDESETEPTTINRLIREILNSFEQSAYVGYTATPFANIFIPRTTDHSDYGEDIFPRDFILQLEAPSNYFGAPTLFGHEADRDIGIAESPGLPLVRDIMDSNGWIPPKHKKDHRPPAVPDSLEEALLSFLLAIAVRRARGQKNVHNTMLVHVTRFVDVQRHVAEQIGEEMRRIRNRLRYGERGRDSVIRRVEQLWGEDYLPTLDALQAADSVSTGDLTLVPWRDVRPELDEAAARIEILKVNGTAGDVLAYRDRPDGLYAIAVGGNKLSRGLTLEGLSVSYYLRGSQLYDTLMQMGRWFGYRPGYLDVCRVYTTAELREAYRHLSLVEEELQKDFIEMAEARRTPSDFGLKVRSHPGGLAITSAGKRRSGMNMEVSYAGSVSESIVFSKRTDDLRFNIERVERLLSQNQPLAKRDLDSGNWILREVPGAEIASFLEGLRMPSGATRAIPSILARYIRAQIPNGELTDWTVGLISNQSAGQEDRYPLTALGASIGLTHRSEVAELPDPERYTIRRLLNPPDEYLDLSEEEREQARDLTIRWHSAHPDKSRYQSTPTTPGGRFVRQVRKPRCGLLLIYLLDETVDEGYPTVGFGVSFPASPTAKAIEYTVNEVYQEELFGDA